MRRKLFKLAAGISLVLWVGVGALWVRGISDCDMISLNFETKRWVILVGGGQVRCGISLSEGTDRWSLKSFDRASLLSSSDPLWFRLFGNAVSAPMWFVFLLPLMCFVYCIRQLKRRPIGHCQMCGYDLRATPERCPECGTAAKAMS